jgi:type IV secretory pathway VirB2 component (pilin)
MSNVTKNPKRDIALGWQFCLAFVIAAAVLAAPDFANAQTNTPIGNIFCTIASWATGNTGKGLATIAITVIGIGALLGKVSWGMAIIVALGVALVFGASTLVNAFNIPGMPSDCSTTASWPSR